MEYITHTEEETIGLGLKIGSLLQAGSVIALLGGLAAGKTTLTKGIAQSLGIQEPVTSPTYTIISEYGGTVTLYHMDCYRLEGEEDALAIGIDELLYGNGICVIEWSERISNLLPPHTIFIELAVLAEGSRRIRITGKDFEARL
ncbi:tRNA (adenosine(37)-N6)-threonylcarbamoyltransferase complex ATPase subunit type 1 TsaE [Gracilinema caldarium]|uniref:tRNA (adenosine(37)-N6)-threonylcarbamoyltransferase complex ATPase subunit type 1 TsaE n=1 Tax=Gracilinema caldarium TaxID=215591 RepID=UPI0026EDED46|nr:tRNA (adenosine(37)-N6)-threonylcarbamoyltransferase complex ATPase subunit type 1 TsaE [Gracilinema caldarium]